MIKSRYIPILLIALVQVISHSVFGQTYATLPYFTGFESGSFDASWTTSAPGNGVVQVTTNDGPYAGSYHATMEQNPTGTTGTVSMWLHLDLSGETQVDLDFQWKEYGDEDNTGANGDGVFFSDDGGSSFTEVQHLDGTAYTDATYNSFSLDLDALCTTYGLSLTSTFVIKFQQRDNWSIANDGHAYDEISVTVPGGSYATLPYTTGFETGSFDPYWTTSAPGNGVVQVTTNDGPYAGSYHATMEQNPTGTTGTVSMWLHLNLSGETQVDLDFQWKEYGDEDNTGANGDGVFFSDDGGSSFTEVQHLDGTAYTDATYNSFSLDLDALCTTYGLSLTSTFVIKFQQRDNWSIANDGHAYDDISVTVPGLSLSNTGPGGVGNLNSNILWVRADSGAYSDAGVTLATSGNTVAQWMDVSGNGLDGTSTTPANRPTYYTNSQNGYPALSFGGNQFLDVPALGISSTSSATYIIAFKDTATGGTGGSSDGAGDYIIDRVPASNELYSLKLLTGNLYAYQKRTDAGSSLATINSTTSINFNPKIIEYRRDYGVDYQFFYNNSLERTVAETNGATTPPAPKIGRHSTTANNGLRGLMYEFMIYNVALNQAQTIIVNNYLKAKYGFSLLSNDIYDMDSPGSGDYDHEVAGIGQASDGSNHTDAQGSGIVRINSASDLQNSEFLLWGHDNGALNSYNVSDYPVSEGIEGRLARVWRPCEIGEVGTVTISFDLATVPGSKTASDLRLLIDTDGDGIFADEGPSGVISGAVNTSGDIFEWTLIDLGDSLRFTIGTVDFNSTPLPITLSEFSAQLEGDVVNIYWTTLNEINNDFFTVERSTDLQSWETIAIVEGADNSGSTENYKVTDTDPMSGLSYYRLRQTDYDGKFSYSDVESISYNQTNTTRFVVIPNPATDIIRVEYDSNSEFYGEISILDLSGHVLLLDKMKAGASTINISSLPSGTYILRLQNIEGEFVQQTKLVID